MDEGIRLLKGFLTVENPEVLLTPCKMRDESWLEDLKPKRVRCTSSNCDDDEECITMHPTGMYLPMKGFDVWILDPEYFPYTTGYAFYLGNSAMKKFGIIVLTKLVDDAMDSIALSYGFQVLYHGTWHYYLKAS